MAMRKATLQVRKCKLADLSSSKGSSVRACNTFARSQVGYLCTTGRLIFIAPLINLHMVGCWESYSRDPNNNTEDSAATCLRMVLGVSPLSSPLGN